jgi:alkanesulfonate monooxygenase SsuD/methylene tetrahydromethanopterin reductase-like flavin-dependent oxidoreductase (luciferase family)
MMGRSIRTPASVSVYPRLDAIAGGCGYPIVGTPEQIVDALNTMSKMGQTAHS